MLQAVEKPDGQRENVVTIFEDRGILCTQRLGYQFQANEDGDPEAYRRTKTGIIKQNPENERTESHEGTDEDSNLNELLPKGVGYQRNDNPDNSSKHLSKYFDNIATKLHIFTEITKS